MPTPDYPDTGVFHTVSTRLGRTLEKQNTQFCPPILTVIGHLCRHDRRTIQHSLMKIKEARQSFVSYLPWAHITFLTVRSEQEAELTPVQYDSNRSRTSTADTAGAATSLTEHQPRSRHLGVPAASVQKFTLRGPSKV